MDTSNILYIKHGNFINEYKHLINEKNHFDLLAGEYQYFFSVLNLFEDNNLFILSLGTENRRLDTDRISSYTYDYLYNSTLPKLKCTIRICINLIVAFYKKKWDLVLCSTNGPILWLAVILSNIWNTKLIHSRHTIIKTNNTRFAKRLYELTDLFFLRKIKAIICHGPFIRNQLISCGIEKQKVLKFESRTDFVNISHQIVTNLFEFSSNYKPYILYVGRIEKEKGIFEIYDAFFKLNTMLPELSLLYVGNGSKLPNLKSMIIKDSIEDRVICLNHISNQHLFPIYKNALALIVSTDVKVGEGRSKVVKESLFCGTPVIAPSYGAFKYLVKNNQNGLLYNIHDTDDLANKINQIVSDHNLYSELKKFCDNNSNDIPNYMRYSTVLKNAYDILSSY